MECAIVSPIDEQIIGTFNFVTKQEAIEKIEQLHQGVSILKKIPPYKKAKILQNLATLLEKNKEDLARTITQEMGKVYRESLAEIDRALIVLAAASEEIKRLHGEIIPVEAYAKNKAQKALVEWHPRGVTLAMTPFNFPINLALHKIAPCFAVGNPVFYKPTPQCYLSAKKLVQLCYTAGIPSEALQLVMVQNEDIAEVIAHPQTSCISFTGGTETATKITANTRIQKVLMELGGNDPLILMEDGDLDEAIQATIDHRLSCSGQRCSAAKRVFIHRSHKEAYLKKLTQRIERITVGDPFHQDTDLGPLCSSNAAQKVAQQLKKIEAEGHFFHFFQGPEKAYLSPVLIEMKNLNTFLHHEEIFGPVIPVFTFEKVEEIIPCINASPYGLQAGVFTQKHALIQQLFDKLEVGTLIVNQGPGFRADHLPFGGVKKSGIGREGVAYAMKEFAIRKTLVY